MSGHSGLEFRLAGFAEVQETLGDLKQSIRNRVLRGSMNKATRLVTRVAKDLVPVNTGTVRKSLGSKVYVKRTVVGLIGPRVGFDTEIDGRKVDPVRTAHFAEGGRKEVVAKGKLLAFEVGGKFVRARRVRAMQASRFLSRAYTRTEGEVMDLVQADVAERVAQMR